ncbi:MAG: NAD(P)/FAD-dependent oxidoreductase [Chloroflexi bacterium]|nr:NAD(P)/FAD-dependent oxidoreductase [Chloroflexota bacterium]
METPNKRIVVLGGGFAGITAMVRLAQDLARAPGLELLLIDRNNYQLFTPMLQEAATGLIEPVHLLRPIRPLAREKGFRFQESQVEAIDLGWKAVETDDGTIGYDYLLICMGSVTDFHGVPGASQRSLTFKTAEDAALIRDAIVQAFEAADHESDENRRLALLTFLIAGGGATGVELAAAIHDFIHHDLVSLYPHLSFREVSIILAEASNRILADLDTDLATVALKVLEGKRIDLRLNTRITEVSPEEVGTNTGEKLRTATVIWTTGVQAGKAIGALPVNKDNTGRVIVNAMLQIPEHPEVYAIGDNCRFQFPEDKEPLPPNAQVAIQQGLTAACNIISEIRGKEKCSFTFRPMADLVSLGRRAGVADLFGFKFHGPTAWLLWKTVYLLRLTSYQNKVRILLSWLLASLFERNVSRFRVQ